MNSHKLIAVAIFALIVGGVAKSTQADGEFLRRLSKLTLSGIKSEYQLAVGEVQHYNGSQLMPVDSYKLALFPPFFIDVIYNTVKRQPITPNAATVEDHK